MPLSWRAWVTVLFLLALGPGCQSRLKIERTVPLQAGEEKMLTIDPPRYDQTVSVSVSADVPVDVYVYLEKDEAAVEKSIMAGKPSDAVLASKTNTQNDSLEVRVPAQAKAVVRISGRGKSGTAKVTIVGK